MKSSKEFKSIAKAMANIDFCMMQTVGEYGLNTRPMSNNGQVEYDGTSWFFAHRDSNKVEEIEGDDRVHLAYVDGQNMNFISVWGSGEIVDDVEQKKSLWQKELERWFENGPEDEEVVLIAVHAHRIQSWGQMGDHDLNMDV